MKRVVKNDFEETRLTLLASLEDYTQVMFNAQFKKPFIIAPHHRRIFEALQDVVDGKCTRLIINIAPRYSKTEIVVKSFISWAFAINPKSRFIHLSYSDMLVTDNSRTIQEIMSEPLYTRYFPESALLSNRISGTKWETSSGGGLYAVSTQGQVTGFGAGEVDQEIADEVTRMGRENEPVFSGAIVIDDPIKPEEALSDNVRERINQRFENTIRNRVNSRNTPIIIIMQRLHEHDLCGYLQESEPDEWRVLSLPCIYIDEQGEEQPLWPHKHTLEELRKIESVNSFVFETQYMQNPKPIEGLMYSSGFREYERIPISGKMIRKNYTDTADTGADYLCSICYTETETACYVEDVLYTKKPMEYTEPATAEMMTKQKTQLSAIEGNNGGRGFARAVEAQMRLMGNKKTRVTTFTQSANKAVRIFSKSAEVQNMIYFPVGWTRRWPEFATAVLGYRKEGNRKHNAHDDAPDTLTGMVEKFGQGNQNPEMAQRIEQALY